ncbi:inner membrane protein [Ruminococcus sp. YE71]|nr:YgjV family protein [Ruminococcus sp. YE78]SDA30249.1 inner membrane protein [Ruminococcus sp. YE78]SFW49302.1 inner membrane protein [Ruminococcus sp. YE71]
MSIILLSNAVMIGNIISFFACSLTTASGFIRSKKIALLLQSVQMTLSGLVCIILGSPSGAIINFISIFRNILCSKDKLNNTAKGVIIGLSTVLSLMFNTRGMIGLIPVAATILYTLFLDKFEGTKFKWLMIATWGLWTVHDFAIQSYVSSVFNVLTMVTAFISIVRSGSKTAEP